MVNYIETTMGVLIVKPLLFYIVALVFLSSCGGGGSESSNELLDQTDQTDQILDVDQESITQTVTFGGSSFGYTKFQ